MDVLLPLDKNKKGTQFFFFLNAVEHYPTIASLKDAYLTTDEETSIVISIGKIFFTFSSVHVWQNAKLKLRKLGVTSKPNLKYNKIQIQNLFAQDSEVLYLSMLTTLQVEWNIIQKRSRSPLLASC